MRSKPLARCRPTEILGSLRIGGNGTVEPGPAGAEQQPLGFIDEADGDSLKLLYVLDAEENDEDGTIEVTQAYDYYLDAVLSAHDDVEAWCLDAVTGIGLEEEYSYWLFDPFDGDDLDDLEDLVGETRFNDHYDNIPWEKIEWALNNKDETDFPDHDMIDLQFAIWEYTNPGVDAEDTIDSGRAPDPEDVDAIVEYVNDNYDVVGE